jgi:ribosomal protein L22
MAEEKKDKEKTAAANTAAESKKPARRKAAAKKPASGSGGGSRARKPAAKAKKETATRGEGAAEATSKTADSKAAEKSTSKAPAKKPAARKAPAKKAETKPKADAKPKAETKAKPKAKEEAPERPVVNARARFVRVAPRKARLVADQVRGLPLEDALPLLRFSTRSAAQDIRKLLESAAANAETNHDLVADDLLIKDIHVDEGPTLRRYRPRALGRATRINKRTSHIAVALTPED